MGEGWCQTAQAVGRIAGATVVVCYRRERGVWNACQWIAEPLAPILRSWKAPDLADDAELIRLALERMVYMTGPMDGLGDLQPEVRTALGSDTRCGVCIGLRPTLTESLVIWLGLPFEVDSSFLEDLIRIIESISCTSSCPYRSFFENVPALFAGVGVDGNIEYCNDYVRQLGYDERALIGGLVTGLFSQDEWKRLQQVIAEPTHDKRIRGVIRQSSGESVAMDLIIRNVEDPEKGAARTVLMGCDLRQEHQLENYRRLESVSRMVSGVAHELNNPFLTVVGNAEMLADMKLPESARRRAQRVLAGVRRCQEVVDGMLKLKRKRREPVDDVDVAELAGRVARTVAAEFDRPGLPVRIEASIDLPLIKGNREDLEQALENVLRNAFQATAVRSDPELQVDIQVIEQTVQISVRDNGPGLSPEALDRAFEPFFSTRGVGAGKGLGLSIALGIVQEHGGFIELHSSSSGARVLITLPITGYSIL